MEGGTSNGEVRLVGDLTIRGVTREMVLHVSAEGRLTASSAVEGPTRRGDAIRRPFAWRPYGLSSWGFSGARIFGQPPRRDAERLRDTVGWWSSGHLIRWCNREPLPHLGSDVKRERKNGRRGCAGHCPSWARTRTLLIQSQACCQLHQGAVCACLPVYGDDSGPPPYGAEGDRTPDLCSAIAALSQLSYSPGTGGILASIPRCVNRIRTRCRASA